MRQGEEQKPGYAILQPAGRVPRSPRIPLEFPNYFLCHKKVLGLRGGPGQPFLALLFGLERVRGALSRAGHYRDQAAALKERRHSRKKQAVFSATLAFPAVNAAFRTSSRSVAREAP